MGVAVGRTRKVAITVRNPEAAASYQRLFSGLMSRLARQLATGEVADMKQVARIAAQAFHIACEGDEPPELYPIIEQLGAITAPRAECVAGLNKLAIDAALRADEYENLLKEMNNGRRRTRIEASIYRRRCRRVECIQQDRRRI
jgi:hypothetical protein